MITMRSPIASTLASRRRARARCPLLPAAAGRIPRPTAPGATTRPDGAKPKVPATVNPTAAWKEIDRLLDEQKLQEAADRLGPLVASARAAGDETNWAKSAGAAVAGADRPGRPRDRGRGDEGASRGPAGRSPAPRSSSTTPMPCSNTSLATTGRSASASAWCPWAGDQLDLKAWTAEQIAAEAERSFLAVWERREALGGVAVGDFPYLAGQRLSEGHPQHAARRPDLPLRRPAARRLELLVGRARRTTPGSSISAISSPTSRRLAAAPAGSSVRERRTRCCAAPPCSPTSSAGTAAARSPGPSSRHASRAIVCSPCTAPRRAIRHGSAPISRSACPPSAPTPGGRSAWRSSPARSIAPASDPEHRIRARELALAGEKAFPGSRGAQLCRELRAQIEAPDFALQMMAVDGAARRSIEISHRNLARAPPARLPGRSRGSARPQGVPRPLSERRPRDRTADLGQRACGLLERRAAADRGLPDPSNVSRRRRSRASGLYLIVASAERSFAKPGNRRVALPFTLSKLVLLQENQVFPWEVRLVEGGDGRAAAGVEVTLYRNTWREAPTRVATVRTDAAGRATFAFPGESGYSNFLLVARRGDDIAAAQRYGGRAPARDEPAHELSALHRPGGLPAAAEALLESAGLRQRPQPRRAHASAGDAGRPSRSPIRTARGWRRLTVTTNRFGTAAGEFLIPAGRLLGEWTVCRARSTATTGSSRRGVQAPDVRGRGRRPGARAAPQPAGRAHRRGALLLRPAGDLRPRRLAGDAAAGAPLVVALLGIRRRLDRGAADRERHDGARRRRPVPGRASPRRPTRARRRRASPISIASRPTSPTTAARRAPASARCGSAGRRSKRSPRSRPTSRSRVAVRDRRPAPGSRRRAAPRRGPVAPAAPARSRTKAPLAGRAAAASGRRPGGTGRSLRDAGRPSAPALDRCSGAAAGTRLLRRRQGGRERRAAPRGVRARHDRASRRLDAGAYRLRYETRDAFGETGPHAARLRRRRPRDAARPAGRHRLRSRARRARAGRCGSGSTPG